MACFTHVTANPNGNKNYEALESLGDKTMGYCFKFYVKFKEPSADASRINNLDQKYMSKDFQSKLHADFSPPKSGQVRLSPPKATRCQGKVEFGRV